MRPTRIELSSDNANTISFGLDSASYSDKYLAKNLFGLDADEIVSKYYGRGKSSGRKFHTFSLPSRTITMRIVLNPNFSINQTYEQIRDEMYRFISSSRYGELTLTLYAAGAAISEIKGMITKFEVPYMTKVPELQITLECDDPMFRGLTPIEYTDAEITTSDFFLTDNLSTAPHGLSMEVSFSGAMTSWKIGDAQSNPEWEFEVTYDFAASDILYLNSNYGEKSLYVYDDSLATNIPLMDVVTLDSIWPIVFPGSNDFYSLNTNMDIDLVEFYPTYWGV